MSIDDGYMADNRRFSVAPKCGLRMATRGQI
jgi:hypothetical protein